MGYPVQAFLLGRDAPTGGPGSALRYCAGLLVLAAAYLALAKFGLALASINPSTSPIWPPTGFALAAALLWGSRVWPAIFAGALIANATTAGSLVTSLAIAGGNTLEAVVGALVIARWSGGRATFDTPSGVGRFALVVAGIATPISATIGVVSLALAGFADRTALAPIWLTWWLGDLCGALIVAPAVVLWVDQGLQAFTSDRLRASARILGTTCLIGLIALSPILPQTPYRSALAFLAILPLFWAALYRGQRDTATVALALSAFAVWGTVRNGGPFSGLSLNETFLLLLAFMMSISIPSLALAAEVSTRKQAERELRATKLELDQRDERRSRALREAQTALERTETNYRLLVDSVREYAIFMLDPEGHVASWNPGAARIKGYEADEVIGEHFSRFYTKDDRTGGEPMRQLALAAAEGKVEIEGIRVRKDSSEFYSIGTISAVRDESGTLIGYAKVVRDITGRRESQRQLAATREQLLHTQKMEAIGKLTGGIAHDFNNLLMIVSGQAQLLRMKISDPKFVKAVDAIRIAAKRGETLTRQLLTFARRQKLSPVVLDPRGRVEAVRDMLSRSLRENIILVCEVPDDSWPIQVDEAELELALVNVVMNARDAMAEGGTIRVRARNVTLTKTESVEGLEGDFVALSVEDTGNGIAPDLLPKIFEPFFTTKAVDKGTGLGLSQVYGFAHQSGGAVSAKSELGKGTTVTIYLPRSEKAPVQPRAEAPPAAKPVRGTVLIVEDNAEVMEATASMLEEMGYSVARATNADGALMRLDEDPDVTIVFSDIVMPGAMNGLSLAEEVRERFPHIGVLLTSGYSDLADDASTRFSILRKPFEFAALDAALRAAMKGVPAEAF